MKRKLHSWINIGNNKAMCVTCQLIKHKGSKTNPYLAWYKGKPEITFDKVPDCKIENQKLRQ